MSSSHKGVFIKNAKNKKKCEVFKLLNKTFFDFKTI